MNQLKNEVTVKNFPSKSKQATSEIWEEAKNLFKGKNKYLPKHKGDTFKIKRKSE